MKTIVAILAASVFIVVGITTIVKKKSTVLVELWRSGPENRPNRQDSVYSESQYTGTRAILIGIVEIVIGIGILVNSFSSD
jgi:hypothetical protein